jgi:putative ATP-dependent endonuclease of the OLD family
MLTLNEISVRNFRSIREERFVLQPLTIIVGKNDVGKSNLLEAVRVLFEGSAASVDSEDFYDPGQAIEIIAVLGGVREYLELCDEKNRPKIEQRLAADGTLTMRRTCVAPKKLGGIEILDPASGEFGTPTGIDAAIKPILPEVIFIEALADVAEQTKGTQKDALGRLVGQVVSSITDRMQPALDRAYAEANRLLNVTPAAAGGEVDERAEELRDIERDISRHLQETFPNSSVRLKVRLPSLKSILGEIDLLVKEGTHEDPYYRRGHGLQRTLYLSLLRTLAERIRAHGERAVVRPFILLFEEPEAFLHPEGQIKMRNALQAIAAGAQVIMATHSPLMVTPEFVPETLRVEKRHEQGLSKAITRRFGPIERAQLSQVQRQLLSLFAIQRSSRFLFSRGVLLVEGIGDEYLFSAASQRLRNFDLESSEIAVVETGGKDNLVPFSEILRMLGLQTWILTDIDFLWNGAGSVLGGDAQLGTFVRRLDEIVPPLPQGDRNEAAVRDRKRRLKEACGMQLVAERDGLCERLEQLGIFVLREGEIEDYVGLGQSSKGHYIKAAEEIRSGTRVVQHQVDIERLLNVLERWAAPVVNEAADLPAGAASIPVDVHL